MPVESIEREVLEPAPILSTVRHVVTTFERLQIHVGTMPDGWSRSSDVVVNADAVSALLDDVCRMYAMDDRQVAASFLVLGYMWQLMVGTLGCFLLDRRVPDLSAHSVSVHLTQGVSFLSERCLALDDDPAASHPSVTTVGTLDQLRSELVAQVEREHMTPLFATLRSVAPLGINAMRANAIDRLASAIIWLGDQLDDPAVAKREVPAFAALAQPNTRTGIVEIERAGHSRIFLRRAACCLNYRIPGREKCDTCCVLPEPERIERLRQYLHGAH